MTDSSALKPRLVVKGLVAGYGDVIVLKDIDLTIAEREIRIILGGSGCGKSTLMKNIIGIEQPRGGTIELLDQPIDWSQGRPGLEVFRKVGVLFQGGAMISSLTVAENVALPLDLHHPELPKTVVKDMVAMKLEQVGLGEAYHRMPDALSGGMRKRAALARTLILDPDLLFCDEPSAGLDPITSRGLDDLLLELRDALGISLMVVTHELDSIRALCDKMLFLSGGKVIFDGSLEDAEESGPEEVRDFLSRKAFSDSRKSARLTIKTEAK